MIQYWAIWAFKHSSKILLHFPYRALTSGIGASKRIPKAVSWVKHLMLLSSQYSSLMENMSNSASATKISTVIIFGKKSVFFSKIIYGSYDICTFAADAKSHLDNFLEVKNCKMQNKTLEKNIIWVGKQFRKILYLNIHHNFRCCV